MAAGVRGARAATVGACGRLGAPTPVVTASGHQPFRAPQALAFNCRSHASHTAQRLARGPGSGEDEDYRPSAGLAQHRCMRMPRLHRHHASWVAAGDERPVHQQELRHNGRLKVARDTGALTNRVLPPLFTPSALCWPCASTATQPAHSAHSLPGEARCNSVRRPSRFDRAAGSCQVAHQRAAVTVLVQADEAEPSVSCPSTARRTSPDAPTAAGAAALGRARADRRRAADDPAATQRLAGVSAVPAAPAPSCHGRPKSLATRHDLPLRRHDLPQRHRD